MKIDVTGYLSNLLDDIIKAETPAGAEKRCEEHLKELLKSEYENNISVPEDAINRKRELD